MTSKSFLLSHVYCTIICNRPDVETRMDKEIVCLVYTQSNIAQPQMEGKSHQTQEMDGS